MGSIPWVVLQLVMVGLVVAFPKIVTWPLSKPYTVDPAKVKIELPQQDLGTQDDDPAAALQKALGGK
jgi:hypothetical protein